MKEPPYVHATRLMVPWRVYTARWAVRVSISSADACRGAAPAFHWNRAFSSEYERVRRNDDRLVALSVLVTGQDARRMPVDVALSVLVGDRPYIVRAREQLEYADDGGGVELLRPGDVYTNDACTLAFCALHALDFDRETSAIERVGAVTLVPCRYRYAELIRQVAMARELERLPPLQRRCAVSASLATQPQRTSTAWRYDDVDVESTLDAIETMAAALRRHTLLCEHFAARPLEGEAWTRVVDADARAERFECTVRFTVFFARIDAQ